MINIPIMNKAILYKNTPNGFEFCYYEIEKQTYKKNTHFCIQFNEGALGILHNFEVYLQDELLPITIFEKELLQKYPLRKIPFHSCSLIIDLSDYKYPITPALIKSLTRCIEWNSKCTGLGFVKAKLTVKNKILSTTLKLTSPLHLHEIIAHDLDIMQIIPYKISVEIN